MLQNGAERPFSPICVHSLSPRLSTTAHLTERHTLHSPLDRGETKKRILLQRLTKNRSLVSPGVVECAFPSRRGAREVWGNPPPGCGALWRMAQLGKCARATPRQPAGRVVPGSADLGSESGLTEKRTLQPTQTQQCTQMPQNGFERPFSPICVHSFAPRPLVRTGRATGPTTSTAPWPP